MSHPSQRTVWTKLRGAKTGTTSKQKKWRSHCKQIGRGHGKLVVMGHSRGGGMAILGARQFQKAGGSLSGVACWAPVSDVFARFPWGPALKDWEASDRLEVLNGRTGQTLVHPYAFFLDAKARESDLNIESAAKALTCPVLVVHGTDDAAVVFIEERPSPRGQHKARWRRGGCQPCVWHGPSVDRRNPMARAPLAGVGAQEEMDATAELTPPLQRVDHMLRASKKPTLGAGFFVSMG